MEKFKQLWLICAVCFVLAGCIGPQLYHQQLSLLNKGMATAETVQQLKQSPRVIQKIEHKGRTFVFHKYMLNNGVQFDQYYLAFESDRLIYWGYITEFRRQPDQVLNEALSLVLATQSAANQ